jgi:nickel-dependent lactate racemase
MVITSGGAFPLDTTLYQGAKALICAKNILRKGGAIVLAMGCQEGLGSPEFSGVMRSVSSLAGFTARYSRPEDLVIDQWCAQNIFQALDHAGPVFIYSPGLSREDVERMGASKIDDLQATIDRLAPDYPRVAVSPDGPYVVGMLAR